MSTNLGYPHVVKRDGGPASLERLPRVRVAQIVMDYLAHGWSPDEMVRQHPDLLPAEVYAAMTYYFDHREEIDEEIRDEIRACDLYRTSTSPSALVMRLLEARKR